MWYKKSNLAFQQALHSNFVILGGLSIRKSIIYCLHIHLISYSCMYVHVHVCTVYVWPSVPTRWWSFELHWELIVSRSWAGNSILKFICILFLSPWKPCVGTTYKLTCIHTKVITIILWCSYGTTVSFFGTYCMYMYMYMWPELRKPNILNNVLFEYEHMQVYPPSKLAILMAALQSVVAHWWYNNIVDAHT